MATLGEIIKAYREEHSLSLSDFARMSGFSKAYVSCLERNYNPTTGRAIQPGIQTIQKAAKGMYMDFNTLFEMVDDTMELSLKEEEITRARKAIMVPILGRVAAGVPIEAVEDILGYEEIDDDTAHLGDIFALRIKGDSMTPTLPNGSTAIVLKQDDANHGDIVIALVNGDDATCKRLYKSKDSIRLMPDNPAYQPLFFTAEEIESKPVKIIGKVIEVRTKFI